MKTFKEFAHQIFIIEAKIDDLKLKHSSISTSHDPHGKFKTSSEIIDHFHSHNPTGNIQHTNWAIGQYNKGNLKQEDAPMVKDTLQHFNKYKPKLEKKNIDQYKSIGELHGALQPHIGTNKADVESKHAENVIKSGSTLVHNSKDVKLYHVHNTEASCELGKGMPWCTSRRDENNMFNHYNQSSGGKFYIAHLPNESAPHRKIGIGVGTGEFQDENNDRISHTTLSNLVKNNPSLGKIKELQGVRVATTQDVHKHAVNLIQNDNENIGHMKSHPSWKGKETENKILQYQHEFKEATNGNPEMAHSEHVSVRKELASNFSNAHKIFHGDESVNSSLNKLKNDENHEVRAALVKNKYVPYNVRFDMASNDKSPFVRGQFSNYHDYGKYEKEDLHKMVANEKHPDVLAAWSQNVHDIDHIHFLKNKNSPSEALHGINFRSASDVEALLKHPNAPSRTLGKIAAHYPEHESLAFSHKNFNEEALNVYGVRHESPNIDKIVSNKHFSPSTHSDILWSHGKKFTDAQTLKVLQHPKYNGENNHYLNVGDHSSPEVQKAYVKHIPTTHSLREFQAKLKNHHEDVATEIVNHPHANSYIIEKMAHKFPNNEHIVGKYFNHPDTSGMDKGLVAKKSTNPNIQKDYILNHPTFADSSNPVLKNKHDPIDLIGFEKHGASDEVKQLAKKKLIKDHGEKEYPKLHDELKDWDHSDFKHHFGGDWEEEK